MLTTTTMPTANQTAQNLSALEIAQANVRQLQSEAAIPKIKVSIAIKDLQAYIEEHQKEDYLVRGFENSPKKNPFRKKKLNTCNLF
jgi:hypothetical protein